MGGRANLSLYKEIINFCKNYGEVLTEHVSYDESALLSDNGTLLEKGKVITPEYIYERDVNWMNEADIVIAEVSTPSLGVGYEIRLAEEFKKPIICFFRKTDGNGLTKKLSSLIKGNKNLKIIEYEDMPQIKEHIKVFLSNFDANS